FGTEIAYRLNKKNTFEFYSSTYNDDRHFALLTPHQNKTKYQNNFTRNLLKWHYKSHRFLNTFYLANIRENYTYFDQLPSDNQSSGAANMWWFKHESHYYLTPKLKLSALFEYQETQGEGKHSNLPFSTQEIVSLSVLANYEFFNQSGIEIGLKNERAKDYQNPFLFSAGYYWNTNNYQLKINTSKNYRIPTFNDLYWQPGGNLNLKPETSYQFDINNDIKFKSLTFNFSTYYTTIKNMIRWVPTSTGFWEANNADEVAIYGADVLFSANKNWNKHSVSLNSNYSYTKSIDQLLNKQLTYTPLHKFNLHTSYQYNKISISPSFQYIGKIYTTSSNDESSALAGYGLISIDFQYHFYIKKNPFTFNFKVNNLANTIYTNMPERLMPGRNFTLQLIQKF